MTPSFNVIIKSQPSGSKRCQMPGTAYSIKQAWPPMSVFAVGRGWGMQGIYLQGLQEKEISL